MGKNRIDCACGWANSKFMLQSAACVSRNQFNADFFISGQSGFLNREGWDKKRLARV